MRSIVLILATAICIQAHADQPAFEYFVIKRGSIPKTINSDDALLALPAEQLAETSEAHGWLESIEKCSVSFSSKKFRLDLRTGIALSAPNAPKAISYMFSAGGGHDWGIISAHGEAFQVGGSFLTRSWQNQNLVVIFRPINLKH